MRNKLKPDKRKSHKPKGKWYGEGDLDNIWFGSKRWIKGQVKVFGKRKRKLHRNTVYDLVEVLLKSEKSIKDRA